MQVHLLQNYFGVRIMLERPIRTSGNTPDPRAEDTADARDDLREEPTACDD